MPELVVAAQERGWEVGVIATPVARGGFFDVEGVAARTGRPVPSAPCFGAPYTGAPGPDGRRPEFGWTRGLDLVGRA